MKTFEIDKIKCDCVAVKESRTVTYLIYPELVPFPAGWQEEMSKKYNLSIVLVYIPADGWNDDLTPWSEPGEAKGFPPFAGKGAEMLKRLQTKIIPEAEKTMGITAPEERDLIGVSLSGLFTLWQWMLCDTFRSIGSLSGSFWYDGFLDWFDKQPVPKKEGKAFFLLGEREPKAHVKAYQSVGVNTEAIVKRLKDAGIDVTFEWVPGDHFSDPLKRAALAFENLYGN